MKSSSVRRPVHGESAPSRLAFTSLPDPLEKCNVIWDASAFGYQVDAYLLSGSGTTFAPFDDTEAGLET